MAERDFRFNVDVRANEAKDTLRELEDIASRLENIKVGFDVDKDGTQTPDPKRNTTTEPRTPEANRSESLNQYIEFMKTYAKLQRDISKYGPPSGMSSQDIRGAQTDARKMAKTVENEMRRSINQYQRVTGERVGIPNDANQLRTSSTNAEIDTYEARLRRDSIRSELRRFQDVGDTGRSTGKLSYTQGSRYQSSMDNFLTYYQGIQNTPEEVLSDPDFAIDPTQVSDNSVRGQAVKGIEEARLTQADLEERLEAALSPSSDLSQEEQVAVAQQLTKEINDQKRLLEINQDIINALDASMRSARAEAEKMEMHQATEGDIRVGPDPDSMLGKMASRSAASAMALMGAVSYAVTGAINRGQTTTRGQMPSSQEIGFRTGNTDFRSIRLDSMDDGVPYGFTGQQMMDFQDSILNSFGFTNREDLESMAVGDAQFAKLSGVGEDQATGFNEAIYSSGGVSNRDQIKAIQEGFIGGIRASGMEGREKEQIDALTTLISAVGDGREMSNAELNERMSMAAMLSATGSRAWQGDNLAQNMGGLDSFYQDSPLFSLQSQLMGGVGAYGGGFGGAFRMAEDQQQGFTAERYNEALSFADAYGQGDDPEAVMGLLHSMWGDSVTPDAIRALVESNPDGISQEELDSFMEENVEEGSEEMEDRDDSWMESTDQLRESNDRLGEKIEALLSENVIADIAENVKGIANNMGATNSGTAMAHTAGQAVLTGISTGLANVGWSFLAEKMIEGASSKLGGGTGTLATIFNTVGGGLKGLGGKLLGGLGTAWSGAKGLFSGGFNPGGVGQAMSGGLKTTTETIGKATTLAPKSTGITAAIFRGIEGIGNVMESDNKARAVTREGAGTVGAGVGAWGVAKLGMAAGSVFGPWGTLLGGLAGGVAGGLGGDKLLTWLGDKVGGGLFGEEGEQSDGLVTTVEAGELEEGESPYGDNNQFTNEQRDPYATELQEDYATQASRYQTEVLREDNIGSEKENLSMWDNLLNRIATLLDTARAQNGIIGTMNAAGMGGASGGGSGHLSNTQPGEYWTNQDITKHDLAVTSNALTAEDLDRWINDKAPSNSIMRGQGSAFMKAGQVAGLDPRYLVSHAAHETAWGTSRIAREKGNMYGIGAFDASPYASAYDYDNTEAGIIEGAKWIRENYYDKRGATTLSDMNEDYATDSHWAEKVAASMRGAEQYTQPSVTNNINVNYTGTGDPYNDGQQIAAGISDRFTTEYRPI